MNSLAESRKSGVALASGFWSFDSRFQIPDKSWNRQFANLEFGIWNLE
jgi:hypothetical protein